MPSNTASLDPLYGILRSTTSYPMHSSPQDTKWIHGILPMRFARFPMYTVSSSSRRSHGMRNEQECERNVFLIFYVSLER
jgi:hypothetical protein